MDRDDPAYRGQADYNRAFLRVYDRLILGFFSRFVWRMSTRDLERFYREHIRPNHLDVGPGTGYFLDRAGLPDGSHVTILDPNANVLEHVTRRLRRLDVSSVQADVLKPLPVSGLFDSVGLSGVLHCLPGPMERKAPAIENIARVLAPDGVLFGNTILGSSAKHSFLARMILPGLNRRGVFSNLDDTEDGLRAILERSFADVQLKTAGVDATFVAKAPIRT